MPAGVRALDVQVVRVPLRGALGMTIGSFTELDHVLVTITTADGLTGRGEATVVPEFLGETVETILADVEVLVGALWTVGTADADAAREAIGRHRPEARSAAAAVDQACHDIAAQRLAVPVWRMLGERRNPAVACTWVIGLMSAADTVAVARERCAAGYRTFKVKVGADDEEDVTRVRLLREALGPDVRIRLDANGAYAPDRALRVLDGLLAYDLELVEQPCAAGELDGMARLRRSLGVRVLADESVFSAADAARVVEAGAADLVNIKVQKLGGLRPALEVAELVAAAGLGCIVGSCLEVGPGAAASAHLAVVCPALSGDSDLLAGVQSAAASPLAGAAPPAGPVIAVSDGPGLGWTS